MVKGSSTNEKIEDNENYDDFGFNSVQMFDRTVGYNPIKPFPSTLQVVFIFMIVVIIVIYASMGVLAGYYSWNEFPEDYILNKVIKTYMAVIFSPIYMVYVFLKVTIFNKPM
tara:strand:- start:770 stop:1105 length:336 start_codon:yes stop_codon:yes gene_type:complete